MKPSDFRKKLFSLVLPIAFSQFMLTLVSACDALMLGRLTQNAMSAVSLAGQVAFVLSLFTVAITIGASMFAAQYWGKGDRDAVERIFGICLRVSLVVGAAFTLTCAAFPRFFMAILTDVEELRILGAGYLRSVSLSYVLTAASQVYLCMMKNSQQAKRATAISFSAVVINIVLNALLIFGLGPIPALGIQGAAYATVTARILEFIMVAVNARQPQSIHLRLRHIVRPDKLLGKTIWKYTLPVLGNELVWGIGFTMSTVILGHMGSDAVAANSIASIARNLIVCFCIGLGSGGGILVGNELGAGNLEGGKALGSRVTKLSICAGGLSGLLVVLLIPVILYVTDLSPQSDSYLIWMLVISGLWVIGKSVNCTTIGGIFCAGGDSKFGFICDTITLWCIIVPLGLLTAFCLHWPVLAVYAVVNMDELIKLPAVWHHYKKYIWVKDLTKLEETL